MNKTTKEIIKFIALIVIGLAELIVHIVALREIAARLSGQ